MSFSAGKSDTSINFAIICLIKTFVSNSFSHVLILINYFYRFPEVFVKLKLIQYIGRKYIIFAIQI